MVSYLVEYERPGGAASWWASGEGITPSREWASPLSLTEALAAAWRTIGRHDRGLIRARIRVKWGDPRPPSQPRLGKWKGWDG